MIDKKNSTWKPLKDFQALVVSQSNPLTVLIEKQISNQDKVTIYWEQEASSSLFDESETFKVSVSIKLAELLKDSGLIQKQGASSTEEDFIALLEKKIAEKQAAVQKQE